MQSKYPNGGVLLVLVLVLACVLYPVSCWKDWRRSEDKAAQQLQPLVADFHKLEVPRESLRDDLRDWIKQHGNTSAAPSAQEMLTRVEAAIQARAQARAAEGQKRFEQIRVGFNDPTTRGRLKLQSELAFLGTNSGHAEGIAMLSRVKAEIDRQWTKICQQFDDPLADLSGLDSELQAFKDDVYSQNRERASEMLREFSNRERAGSELRRLIEERKNSTITRPQYVKGLHAISWARKGTPQALHAGKLLAELADEDLKSLLVRFNAPKTDADQLWQDLAGFVAEYADTPSAAEGHALLDKLFRDRPPSKWTKLKPPVAEDSAWAGVASPHVVALLDQRTTATDGKQILSVALCPDGKHMAIAAGVYGSGRGEITVWNMTAENPRRVAQWGKPGRDIQQVAFDLSGNSLLVAYHAELLRWDPFKHQKGPEGRSVLRHPRQDIDRTDSLHFQCFGTFGEMAAFSRSRSNFKFSGPGLINAVPISMPSIEAILYEPRLQREQKIRMDWGGILSIRLAHNRSLMALFANEEVVTGIDRGVSVESVWPVIQVWDRDQRQTTPENGRCSGFVRNMLFSPDNESLAVSADQSTVLLWKWAGSKLSEAPQLNHAAHSAMAFAPDGKTLATAGVDGRLIFWDVHTQKIKEERQLGSGVQQVLFTLDGQHLITAHDNGAVIVQRLSN